MGTIILSLRAIRFASIDAYFLQYVKARHFEGAVGLRLCAM